MAIPKDKDELQKTTVNTSASIRVLTNRKVINEDPCDYLYSSANFYMEGGKLFSFLKDL
jgi:hypothetical protein